jgi:RNA polymerase-binding protein DksA
VIREVAMDQNRVRETLNSERSRVIREISDVDEALSISLEDSTDENLYDQHMADSATPMLNREIDVSLEENARNVLAQINRALQKLDEGTYGICDNCGQEINEERLEVVPYANLCVDCKRRLERS